MENRRKRSVDPLMNSFNKVKRAAMHVDSLKAGLYKEARHKRHSENADWE